MPSCICVALLVVLSGCIALAAQAAQPEFPPLPTPRPGELSSTPQGSAPASVVSPSDGLKPVSPQPMPAPVEAAAPPAASGPTCIARLTAAGMRAEVAVAPDATNPACVINAPVRLSALDLAKGQNVAFPDRPIVECEFAIVLADYMQVLVAPLGAATMQAAVTSVHTGPGFECRGRNRAAGGKISAHGRGLAVDITSVEFSSKRQVRIEHQNGADETAFMHAIRRAACGWFSTVLGPGADAFHDDNLHLDIESHGSSGSYRICQ